MLAALNHRQIATNVDAFSHILTLLLLQPYSITGSLPLVQDMKEAGFDVQVCRLRAEFFYLLSPQRFRLVLFHINLTHTFPCSAKSDHGFWIIEGIPWRQRVLPAQVRMSSASVHKTNADPNVEPNANTLHLPRKATCKKDCACSRVLSVASTRWLLLLHSRMIEHRDPSSVNGILCYIFIHYSFGVESG